MAVIASGAALGAGLGPVMGGIVTQYLGWNYLFVVTGATVLFIPFFQKLLPKEMIKNGHFDLYGAILTGLSAIGLLLSLSTFSYVYSLGTIILFVTWWRYINKNEAPFIPPILFQNKQYIKLLFIGFIAFYINFSNLFLMPIILTTVYGKEPIEVGMMIFPGAIVAVIAGQFIGRVIDRFGNAPCMILGQIFLLGAMILFAWLSTRNPYNILFSFMFASVGFNALSTSISNEITRVLPTSQIGSGMATGQLIQFFGGALGVTISGLLLKMQDHLSLEIVYRNIYICSTFIIIMAVFIYVFYYRSAKLKAAEFNSPSLQ